MSVPTRWPVGDEVVVEVHDGPDGQGRYMHTRYWWGPALWDETGRDCADAPRSSIRSQVFHCPLPGAGS